MDEGVSHVEALALHICVQVGHLFGVSVEQLHAPHTHRIHTSALPAMGLELRPDGPHASDGARAMRPVRTFRSHWFQRHAQPALLPHG
jgi:hypothetical protein